MGPEQWQQLKKLYAAVEECAIQERTALLDQAEAEDPEVCAQLRALLAYRAPTDDFLEQPVALLAGPAALPATIGRYRILRFLGEGGMGIVYEAEQDHPRRMVALKIIKPGFAGPELLRRFELEAEALGRLHHPGIAQIYEAGTAESGAGTQPYFAMELIRGEPLRHYAEEHQLNTQQRLALLVQICEAVHHAHQYGVIHRDLKPGNILVEESGQPKILDFGVARLTNSNTAVTRQTDLGQLVGTLAYMSPEQVLADSQELDARSDVYALGVILYELLAGRLPYNISPQLHEAVRTIREEEPTPLRSVHRTYRGDIETIIAKALEKDPARRYSSAADLARDLQRYLSDEPIAARRPSATYQLQKFACRHKGLVGGVAAVFAVLIAGIIISTWQATRARHAEQSALRERDRAAAAERVAKAVNDFLQNDILAQASAGTQARPDTKPDPDLKVRTALDRAAARLHGQFDRQPVVEASIRQTIGNTYTDLGLYPDAQRQLERAFELRRRVLGEEHPDTLSSINNLASLYRDEGQYAQAEPLYTRVLEGRRRVLGEEHPDTLSSMDNLATLYLDQGQYAQAEPLYTRVLEGRRRVLGEEHPDTLNSMHELGALYWNQGQYAQAEPLYTRVLEVRRRVLGPEHPETLNIINDLALLYRDQGKYAQAEPLLTKLVEVLPRMLGEQHPDTLISTQNLASLYRLEGKYAQAESLFTKVMEIQRRVLGEQHPNTLATVNNLAMLYTDQEKFAQAEPLFTKVVEVAGRVLGADHPKRLDGMNSLALLYLYEGKYVPAEAVLRQALVSHQKALTHSWAQYHCQSLLGASLAGQHKYGEAEPLLLSGYQGMMQREATIPAYQRSKLEQARKWIVQLYRDWGKPEQAAQWQQKLQSTASVARGRLTTIFLPPLPSTSAR